MDDTHKVPVKHCSGLTEQTVTSSMKTFSGSSCSRQHYGPAYSIPAFSTSFQSVCADNFWS